MRYSKCTDLDSGSFPDGIYRTRRLSVLPASIHSGSLAESSRMNGAGTISVKRSAESQEVFRNTIVVSLGPQMETFPKLREVGYDSVPEGAPVPLSVTTFELSNEK